MDILQSHVYLSILRVHPLVELVLRSNHSLLLLLQSVVILHAHSVLEHSYLLSMLVLQLELVERGFLPRLLKLFLQQMDLVLHFCLSGRRCLLLLTKKKLELVKHVYLASKLDIFLGELLLEDLLHS